MSPSRFPPRRPFALKPIARAARVLARPVYKKHGLSEGAIGESWAEIVGDEWARVSSPRHLNRASRTLTLRVAGARALEMAHQEREIVSRINAFAGRELVLRLKLVQGPLISPSPRAHTSSPARGGGGRGPEGGATRSAAPAPPSVAGATPPPPAGEERPIAGAAQTEALKSALSSLGSAVAERAIKTR